MNKNIIISEELKNLIIEELEYSKDNLKMSSGCCDQESIDEGINNINKIIEELNKVK